MTVDYRLIGARIKEARKEKGLTQESVAERLDVSVGYISQVERGVTKISLDLLGSFSGILEKDLAYFVSRASTENKDYLLTEWTESFQALTEENRRILHTTALAMLKEQNENA